ncbi:MAG TPA: pyridoxal phosphate-dependent aminotransferase family protein [Ktedonobacteraceae bacterium]
MVSWIQDYAQWEFEPFIQATHEEGLLYDIPILRSPANAMLRLGQQMLVNFAGINFLGLQDHQEIMSHFMAAAQTYGLVTGGSRLLQGVCLPHAEVEQLLCQITGKERALTFASGALANIGFLQAMNARFHKNDTCNIDNSDSVFVLDRDSHWSLRKGIEHLAPGRQRFYFEHNDPDDLARVLSNMHEEKVVVVFESVYSSDGSIAPIGAILDVCERYSAVSYIDDANGFLIYGPEHRPFAEAFAHLSRATFIMVSFSKAVGLEGGAIAGPCAPIRAFELLSGTSIFTAAMQPPTASTAHLVMQKLYQEPEMMDRYLKQAEGFRQKLQQIGCLLNETPSYIISIFLGEDKKVRPVRQELLERGYLVSVFHYPLTKFNQAFIRIIPHLNHTEPQIDGFIAALAKLKKIYAF